MTFAKLKPAFENLIYQYIDGGGSPDRIDEWATEDLEYLKSLIDAELQRRSVQVAERHE